MARPLLDRDRCMTMGLLAFHGLTILDLTGPYEVLSRAPGARVLIISGHPGELTIRTEHGLRLIADMDITTCDQHLDLLLVPGGPGQLPLMEAEAVLAFIRQWALNINPERGRFFLTSVCTGALVLAATGLLVPLPPLNRRVQATTHWLFRPLLEALGVELRDGRSVWCDVATRVDGNERAFTLVTGGGITAGIDFALDVVARLYGTKVAQGIQLAMEYDPAPPTPLNAVPAAVHEQVRGAAAGLLEGRWAAVRRIQQRLGMADANADAEAEAEA